LKQHISLISFINKTVHFLRRHAKIALSLFLLCALTACVHNAGVLNPKGLVAAAEKKLMIDAFVLMLIVVIPVIIMSFAFAWRYRAKNTKSKYLPNWGHDVLLEVIWWGVPTVIIIILGIMTWISTHRLDPYRKLDVPGKPMLVEVVSLRWQWLFIYPKQNIATVNYLQVPKGKQVEFWITSDAPMSSFFIPQLTSQIYTMAGMRTRLHMVADYNGTYRGLNAQYTGAGFSDMHFNVKVSSSADFKKWVSQVKQSHNKLTIAAYKKLVKPTTNGPVQYYSQVRKHLFKRIMQQYTKPNMRLH
jgi:cytochrome o ubiquinol oxidase subunit II